MKMKRVISLVLALVLLVGNIPTGAFGTENSENPTESGEISQVQESTSGEETGENEAGSANEEGTFADEVAQDDATEETETAETAEVTEATEETEVTEADEVTEATEATEVTEAEEPEVIHEHEYAAEVTDPTCTEQGYTTYTCECGDSYVDDYVEASGHSYENGVCTDCGLETEIADLFVFAGQSNMMGAAVLEPKVNCFTDMALEYKYMPKLRGAEFGSFVSAQNPAGEFFYNDLSAAYGDKINDLSYLSTLTDYSANTYFCPAMSNGTKGFSGQSEADTYPSASLAPYFVTEYASYGHTSIYAHMAKGAVKIEHYFTEEMVECYNVRIAEYNIQNNTSYSEMAADNLSGAGDAFDDKFNSMIEDYAVYAPDNTVENKCFVWLQGEGDAGGGYVPYKLKMQVLWEHLQELGFTHFFVLRVGYWGNTSILNVIKAQEDFCEENDNCYIVTRAPSLIPHPTATTDNWWISEPSAEYADCRDSYLVDVSNHHFNEKAMQIFAERSAENVHRILHEGLEPILEDENIQGMVEEDTQTPDATPYTSYIGTEEFSLGLSVSKPSATWMEKSSATAASTDLIPVASTDSVWIQYVFYMSEAHAVGGFYDIDGNLVAPLYYKDFGFSLDATSGGVKAFKTPEYTNRVAIADVEAATGTKITYVRFTAWQASAGGHANTEARIYHEIHTHTYTSVVTAPTCTERGYTTYTCECGDSYVSDYVEASGHSYENGVCSGCGDVAEMAGKKLSILGASISTYTGISNNADYNSTIGSNAVYYTEGRYGVYADDTWWMQAANDLGLELLVNNAWSGSSLLYERNGTAGAYVDRCVQLHNNDGEEPDIIAIQMGTNDFQYYKDTLGTADIDYATLIVANEDGSYTYAEPETSLEAAAIVLHKISVRYPGAEVYYLNISQRVDGTDELIRSFNGELKQVVEHFGANIVDIYGSAITMEDFDTYIGDGRVHPNTLGMDAYTEAFKRSVIANTNYQVETHTVSFDLTDVTADYGDDKIVVAGDAFSVNLTSADSLQVTVTMGGEDITASSYADGVVTIDAVTADVIVMAAAVHEPRDYRWEFDGTEMVSADGENALTKNGGTTTDGVFSNTRYALEKSVVLEHDRPWTVVWKCQGTFQNSGGSSGARIFTSDDVNGNYNARYIFKSNKNGLIAMGEKTTTGSHNYGIALGDHGIDWTALHTYRLENRIASDGSNMVYLYVDGVEIGAMNQYYVGTTDKNTASDWLSGKDFTFPYMGTDTHGFTNAEIEYIAVWENGHSHNYENGVCSGCGAIGMALENFSYELDTANKTVTLTKYIGSDASVAVADSYSIDGVAYATVLDSSSVFRYNCAITSVVIGSGVGFKDNSMAYLFSECKKLVSVDMTGVDTSEITSMAYLFDWCNKLTTITGYENWDTGKVESIYKAFNRNNSIAAVDLSGWDLSKVVNSGWCFQQCYATEIKLPDSLKTISAGFLNHASKVTGSSFTIPAGVEKIGYAHTIYDFATDDFAEFIVAEGNANYKAVDGILYCADGTEMLAVPRNKTFENNTFEIPEGVTFLGELSFSRNYNINTLVLPDSFVIEYVPLNDARYIVFEDIGNINAGTNLSIAIYCYTGITEYAVKDSNPNYASVNGIIYSKDMTEVVAIPARYAQEMVIAEGVTAWNREAMWADTDNNSSSTLIGLLASCPGVSIPASLESISEDQLAMLNLLYTSRKGTSNPFAITIAEGNGAFELDETEGLVVKVHEHSYENGVCSGCGGSVLDGGYVAAVPENQGVRNAIDRAHALTDVEWTPVADVPGVQKIDGEYTVITFAAGKTYKGIPYSGVTANDCYVGLNVSLESYLTAMENENSVLYTENLNSTNKKAATYYGTVCSKFVQYALNVPGSYNTNNVANIPGMQTIALPGEYTVDQIKLGDVVVNTATHTTICTGILYDADGNVAFIEISEAVSPLCRRLYWSVEEFYEHFAEYRLCRYEYIDGTPAVEETQVADSYALMPRFGDRYNYKASSTKGVVDILESGYDKAVVVRDGVVIDEITLNGATSFKFDRSVPGYLEMYLERDDGTKSGSVYACVVKSSVSVEDASQFVLGKLTVTIDGSCGTPLYVQVGSAHAIFCNVEGQDGTVELTFSASKISTQQVRVAYQNEYGIYLSSWVSFTADENPSNDPLLSQGKYWNGYNITPSSPTPVVQENKVGYWSYTMIPAEENTTYYSVGATRMWFLDANGDPISTYNAYKDSEVPFQFTTPEGTAYVNIAYSPNLVEQGTESLIHVHAYESAVTAPTCTEQGYTTYTCECGDSYVDGYVDAKGHTEVIDAKVEPGCTTTGLTEGKHCSDCGKVLITQSILSAKGHSYENGVCSGCGDIEKTKITLGDFAVAGVGKTALSSSNVMLSQKTLIAVPYCGAELYIRVNEGYQVRIHSGDNHNNIDQVSDWLNDGDIYALPQASIYMRASIQRTDGGSITQEEWTAAGLGISYVSGSDIVADNGETAELLKNTELPVLIHISDIHGDTIRAGRAAQFAEAVGADALMASGDLTAYEPDDWGRALFDTMECYPGVNFIYGIGNHDAKISASTFREKIYSAYFAGNAATPNGESYYYLDLEEQKIRIISVNQQEGASTTTSGGTCYSQEQVDWLVETLKATPAGYGVVMMYHSPETTIANAGDADYTEFFQAYNRYDNPTNDYSGYSGTFLMDLVDAFMLRESFSWSYSEQNGESPVTLNADFTQVAEGVEFIAHVTGHLHSDSVIYLPGTACKQLLLGVTCTNSMYGEPGGYYGLADYSDLGREGNTASQDAFNAYVIDRENKTVRILRIGAKETVDGAIRDDMTIPYSVPFEEGEYPFDTEGMVKLDMEDVEWVNYGYKEYGPEPDYMAGVRYTANAVFDVPYDGVRLFVKINAPYEMGIRSGETEDAMNVNGYWITNKAVTQGSNNIGYSYSIPAGHTKFMVSFGNITRNTQSNTIIQDNLINSLELDAAGVEIWYLPEDSVQAEYPFSTEGKTKLDLSNVEWVNYGYTESGADPTYLPGVRLTTDAVLDVPYEGVTFYIKINAPYELGIRSGETDTTMTTNCGWLNNKQLPSGNSNYGYMYTIPEGHEKFVLTIGNVTRNSSNNISNAKVNITLDELDAAGLELWYAPCSHTYENGICTVCNAEHPNLANLEGKVISVLGDSISTFAGYIPVADGFNMEHLARYPQDDLLTDVNETWWMQVIDALDAQLGINDSWRGATVSGAKPVTTGTTGENAAFTNLTRIQNLGSNGTPDLILVYGGTNDLAHVSDVGSFDPATAPTEVDLTTAKWDNLADAYVQLLLRLKHFYPDSQVVCLLPTYTSSYYSDTKLAQGNEVLTAICEHYGVVYTDLRECGITTAELPDGIHPGAEGMDLITGAVVDAVLEEVEMEAGENVVHKMTHVLANAESSKSYYKGVSHGKVFETALTGEDLAVSVIMGGEDITGSVYADGSIRIPAVTGDVVIEARGREKTVYEDYLQQLPEELCGGTNLWSVLEHSEEYYTVSGWGIHASGTVTSITIPVSAGDRIWATSFQASGLNGGTINGIRTTWFGAEGLLESVAAGTVYTEFAGAGYLTAPEGAVAVNIPMWTVDDGNAVYILNREHTYGEWYTVKEVTVTEEGREQRDCEHCDNGQFRAVIPVTLEATVTPERVTAGTDPAEISIGITAHSGVDDSQVTDAPIHYIITDENGKEVTKEEALKTPGTYTITPVIKDE